MLAKVRLDIVAEPEKKDPSAPIKDENHIQFLPVISARLTPILFTADSSPPIIIKFTKTKAPRSARVGFFIWLMVIENAFLTILGGLLDHQKVIRDIKRKGRIEGT